VAKKEKSFFKNFDSMLFTDTEMLNAVALAVASSIKSTFRDTSREPDFFNYMLKHPEEIRQSFQLLKFIWNLMNNKIDEIKKGGEKEIRARRLLVIKDIPPDFFTDVLWKAQLWANAFKDFCLQKGMTKKAIKEQFKIFDRDWAALNDKFLAIFTTLQNPAKEKTDV